MKNRLILPLFALLFAYSFTACVEVTEDLTLNADNSGTMSWTLDMGNMIEIMKSMGAGGEAEIAKSSNQMDSLFNDMQEKLKAIDGISNVQQKAESQRLHYVISYDFANEAALNQAMATMKPDKKAEADKDEAKKAPEEVDRIVIAKKSVTRELVIPGMGSNSDLESMSDQDMQMARMFMEDAAYNYILRLPKKAKKASNKYATIEEGGRVVHTRIPLIEYMESRGKLDLNNTVRY